MEDRATNAANVMSLACEPSGAASWSSAGSAFLTVVPDRGSAVGHRQAEITGSNEIVYANRGAFRSGGTDAGFPTQNLLPTLQRLLMHHR